jgi:hypothetical protein
METIKDLAYWKNNCEENYLTTPISVLRYITELEKSIQLMQTAVVGRSEQLQSIEDLIEFARNNAREWNIENMEEIIDRL